MYMGGKGLRGGKEEAGVRVDEMAGEKLYRCRHHNIDWDIIITYIESIGDYFGKSLTLCTKASSSFFFFY